MKIADTRPQLTNSSHSRLNCEAVKALIVANHFLETDLDKLQAAVSMGYARGKLFEVVKTLPRDRKDWYD
jgi:hypothetical protein